MADVARPAGVKPMRAGLRPMLFCPSVPTNCNDIRLMSRSGASIREASLPAGGEGSKPLFKIGAAKRILKQLIAVLGTRSEEHTYELQSLMRISYAVFCLKKQNTHPK